MAKYMIHAVPKRMWYVEQFLIPSMLEQGINRDDIRIHNDTLKEGNLKACMHAFMEVDDSADGTWHLQDDVIISHDFKEKTEMYDSHIVCGFKSRYDRNNDIQRTFPKGMWFSFPCIRIPNEMAHGCADWVLRLMIGNQIYKNWWDKGVNDDLLFRRYAIDYYKNEPVLNLIPNIVDHVDYLIGGSVNGTKRENSKVRSEHWKDEYLVNELESKLKDIKISI